MGNYYLNFNKNGVATLPSNAFFNFVPAPHAFSVSFWANTPSSVSETSPIDVVKKLNITTSYVAGIRIQQTDTQFIFSTLYSFLFDPEAPVIKNTEVRVDIPEYDKWVLYTWVCDNNEIISLLEKVYVNGVLESSSTDDLGIISNSTAALIGNTSLECGLDDLRFYHKALSQSEIYDIYNYSVGKKITGDEDELFWGSNCDTGEGLTLYSDTSEVNGTLSSDSVWTEGGKFYDFPSVIPDVLLTPLETSSLKKTSLIHFETSQEGDECYLIIKDITYIIKNENGFLVFDYNGTQEHIFHEIEEEFTIDYSSYSLIVRFDYPGSFLFTVFITYPEAPTIEGSLKTYYQLVSGLLDLEPDTWYVNLNKKHALKIYSDFNPIEEV